MTTEQPKLGAVLYPPDKAGARKGPSPWDMSIDELIDYRRSGNVPRRIFDIGAIYALGKAGVPLNVIAALFQTDPATLASDPAHHQAWLQGRAELGMRARTAIVEHAANGNLDAAKYLDKILCGEKDTMSITVSADDTARTLTDQQLQAALAAAGYTKNVPTDSN